MRLIVVFVLLAQVFCYVKVSAQKDAQSKESSILLKNEFIMTGKVIGRDTGNLVLIYYDKIGKFVKDTATLKQGTFKFKGTLKGPTSAQLIGDLKSTRFSDPNKVTVFLEPQDMYLELIHGDFFHARLTGSNTQAEFDVFHKMEEPFQISSDSVQNQISQVLQIIESKGKSTDTDRGLVDLYAKKSEIYKGRNKVTNDFFSSHPNSYVSPYLMWWVIDDRDSGTFDLIKSSYKKLSPGPKTSLFGVLVGGKIKAKEALVVGNFSPGFVAKDINGEQISLKQFENKNYVLLDFWGSWCVHCHEQAPYLKKLYEVYHSKGLEIVSISNDKDREVWRKAIEKDEIGDWHNMLMIDVVNTKNEAALDTKYNVTGYPKVVLIDKKGVIIYFEDGFDEKSGLKNLEDTLVTSLGQL